MLLIKFAKFIIITLFLYVILFSGLYKEIKERNTINNQYQKNSNLIFKKNNINNDIKLKENKTIISASYATDNQYIYPTIVSMTSLVTNAYNNTFYNIHILHPPDLTENSKKFLSSVEERYPDKCSILYFNMGNKYKYLPLNYKLTTPAYYRLSLPNLLPKIERIIWLDSDTLVFEDLTELIQLDMKGNLIMGFLDGFPDALNEFGFKNATVLNSGVLLMDLDSLRKYNYSQRIEDFIFRNKNRLSQQDQTIINVVMQGLIGSLPPKYGIWTFDSKKVGKEYLNKLFVHLKYDEKEFFYALEHPAIIHFIWPKPFWKLYTKFYNKWWDYAKLTGYYWEIYFKSPIQKRENKRHFSSN